MYIEHAIFRKVSLIFSLFKKIFTGKNKNNQQKICQEKKCIFKWKLYVVLRGLISLHPNVLRLFYYEFCSMNLNLINLTFKK